jgi:hypothetical protein
MSTFGDDRIVSLFIGGDPFIEARAANEAAAAKP